MGEVYESKSKLPLLDEDWWVSTSLQETVPLSPDGTEGIYLMLGGPSTGLRSSGLAFVQEAAVWGAVGCLMKPLRAAPPAHSGGS